MPDAPMKAYQGSSGMKSYEKSRADRASDKRGKMKEGSRREEARDARAEAKKTILGKAMTPRVTRGGAG